MSTIIAQNLSGDENLIRHCILNSLRMYNVKFKKTYGEMVIAADSSSWRRDYFPNYKYRRRESREASTVDWGEIFRIIGNVRDEIKEHLPYKVIHVNKAEADDIIGVLVEQTQEFGQSEPVMIVSADKDFIQLQKYSNVKQYSPMLKKFVTDPNPINHLFEHILKGDGADGIPNILSPDNTFVDNIRQSPMTKKKIAHWSENSNYLENSMDSETYRNYIRNKTLIDLSMIPHDIRLRILDEYHDQVVPPRSNILKYFISKKCKLLIECIQEF